MEANVASLSGGNQQKVVMSRALLRKPAMLIADEPTQGVDVGARAEIYRIIREVAAGGIPVIVASSDAHELEGLCDRVIVMSRGQSVVELTGDAVTEERIVRAAVSATTHQDYQDGRWRRSGRRRWGRFLQGDYAPVLILALVIVGLGAYIYSTNDRYINAFNITSVLMLVSALGFIAIGQTVALMVAGIDLSVGPLAGLLVVVASFFLVDERSVRGHGVRFSLDADRRRHHRRHQRSADSVRTLHAGGGNPGDVHRTRRAELRSARSAGRLHELGSHRADHGQAGARALGIHRAGC